MQQRPYLTVSISESIEVELVQCAHANPQGILGQATDAEERLFAADSISPTRCPAEGQSTAESVFNSRRIPGSYGFRMVLCDA